MILTRDIENAKPSDFMLKIINRVVVGFECGDGKEHIAVKLSEEDFYEVDSIGNKAFEDCENLTSVILPKSVTSIGNQAFYGCKRLDVIKMTDSVVSIGYYAFQGCSALHSFDIPDRVTRIAPGLFGECKSLVSVIIPKSVTRIGNRAFEFCSRLASIDIPDSVTSIASYAFVFCRSIVSVTIPKSVVHIGAGAFWSCKLSHVLILDSVKFIGEDAFNSYNGLQSISLPGHFFNRHIRSLNLPKNCKVNRRELDQCIYQTYGCCIPIFYQKR